MDRRLGGPQNRSGCDHMQLIHEDLPSWLWTIPIKWTWVSRTQESLIFVVVLLCRGCRGLASRWNLPPHSFKAALLLFSFVFENDLHQKVRYLIKHCFSETLNYNIMYRLALWPTQPPVQWEPDFFPGVKQSEREADQSPPSSADVRDVPPFSQYVFMALCLVKRRDIIFTFNHLHFSFSIKLSSLSLRDQVSYPYVTGEIRILCIL